MTKLVKRLGRVAAGVLALSAFGLPSAVDAQPSTSGPVVTLDRTEVAPDDLVVLTIDGFAARVVTMSVCGNEARRGSVDCNMIASKGLRLDGDGTATVAQMGVATPPAGCPCVIRVSSTNSDEVAVAPITLIGHQIEPVVGGPSLDDPLVAVTISARAAPRGLLGWIRSNLGGRVNYEVTVTAKNITTELLHQVTVFGSVGRNANDELASLALDDPGEIAAGQTWKQVVSVEVPALSLGSLEWRVVASGAGPSVTTTSATRHRPVLLLLLAMALVIDLSVLAIRRRMRRRRASEAGHQRDALDEDAAATSADRPRELVTTST